MPNARRRPRFLDGEPMFLVELNYVKPLNEVDKHLGDHRAYLAASYANGTFLVSGPKEPRTGGVILASASSREELLATLAADPFQVHGIAEYQVTEFHARAAAPGLERLVGG
jgi:uncharacterized protein YciI